MNSRADNQSANVSIRENQKKHKANAKKSKGLGSKRSLASSRPSKLRTCLRWIPTGRIFAMCGKLTASSNTENKSEKSMCDNASTSNPSEPSSKGFPISTSLLGSWKVYSVICSLNYSNGENQIVSKSSAVTTVDASDKRQQQQDSTSSTSTLTTAITADGNFNLSVFIKPEVQTTPAPQLNKNVISQKVQVHIIILFRSFDNHEFPQMSSKIIKVKQDRGDCKPDEEEEIKSFQDKASPTFRGPDTRSGGLWSGGLDPKKRRVSTVTNIAVTNELGVMAYGVGAWTQKGVPTVTNIAMTNEDVGSSKRRADRNEENPPAPKRRLSSTVVKMEEGEILEDDADASKGDDRNKDSSAEVTGLVGNVENQNVRKVSNWARMDDVHRASKMDFKGPPSENVPKVLPKDKDPKLVNRNRRMLGNLLGTLEVWICQISQEFSQKRTRERMSDQEAKEIKAEAREIMPQPSTVRKPTINPKDKGKKKIVEEDESESEDDDIPQAVKKFKQLESDEEMARKIQEEWEAEEERNKIAEEKATNEALIKNFDDIKARIEADRILAEKLQEQEREQLHIKAKQFTI
ncbi:hypothetical protein Tco_0261420 [Tanacetum coccineum]